jgi:hypothetical protein
VVNPFRRWVPSQNGLFADPPHRHKATRVSSRITAPSSPTMRRPAAHEERSIRSWIDGRLFWCLLLRFAVELAVVQRTSRTPLDGRSDGVAVGGVDDDPRPLVP